MALSFSSAAEKSIPELVSKNGQKKKKKSGGGGEDM